MAWAAELAYAGTNVGSGTSKAMTAARGAEMGNLAREGVSGAREATAAATEKSLAKDMSPRVKNVESASDPRVAQKKLADRKVKPVESRASLSDDLVQKPFDPFAMRHDLEAVYGAKNVKTATLPAENAPGVKYKGGRHPESNVPYDLRGNPVFDYTRGNILYQTELKPADFINKNRAYHLRASTRQLRSDIEAGIIPQYIFSEPQLRAIMSGKAKIPDYTWHHD